MSIQTNIANFREELAEQSREDILAIIRKQNPYLIPQIHRIEQVFEEELTHLNWPDGSPIQGREFTNHELTYFVDPPFRADSQLTQAGISKEDQYSIHVASDPVVWARHFLKVKPRAYQVLMLRHPSLRKVFRLGRRMGKTFSMAIILLHYAYTTPHGRCLVMAPMKSQVALIYEEVMKLAEQGIVGQSITRHVTSPQHEIILSNGSTIRFFTTGMKSGGKSDVARGQEAHVIILDEMDYMGNDDLTALYAMLQKTDENQPEKQLIAASTPSGRREKFYEWCVGDNRFKEFYFPAYCNPLWSKEDEEEFREEYSEMGYRHEIEADWGEDAEGVYPQKYVNIAFREDWTYVPGRTSARSVHLIGVDWDKYGAGPNIVVLEVCGDDYEDERFVGKLRIAYRQEIPKSEFVLSEAVERIIELNHKFNPEYIYVDRGYGDMQIELLQKYGLENPSTGLKRKLKGIHSSSSFEVRDPATKEPIKKDTKVFMVDNLRTLLEREQIMMPHSDEELYKQLIAYIVTRTSSTGKPVFEASGTQVDHAHDALVLACLAYAQNFDELLKVRYTTRTQSFSNTILTPERFEKDKIKVSEDKGDDGEPPTRARTAPMRRRTGRNPRGRTISRKMF